jgi:hypothetical protein
VRRRSASRGARCPAARSPVVRRAARARAVDRRRA